MRGSYDDVLEDVSEMLAAAVLDREEAIDVLDVDAGVRVLLRAVGLRTTQRLVDATTTSVLEEVAARGFIVNRGATVAVDCLYGRLEVSSPYRLRRQDRQTARQRGG